MVIEIVIEKQKFKVIVIVIDYFTPVIATTLIVEYKSKPSSYINEYEKTVAFCSILYKVL